MRRRYMVILSFLAIFLFGACRASVPSPNATLERLRQGFSAEVHGSVQGEVLDATISCQRLEAQSYRACITYRQPSAVEGVTIRGLLQRTEDGEIHLSEGEVSRGTLSFALPGERVEVLLQPLCVLLGLSDTPETVSKIERGYQFTFCDGQTLLFDADGVLCEYASPSLFFQVLWWENEAGALPDESSSADGIDSSATLGNADPHFVVLCRKPS